MPTEVSRTASEPENSGPATSKPGTKSRAARSTFLTTTSAIGQTLSSSTTIGVIGVMVSILLVVFAIWVRVALARQATVTTPTAQAASLLDSGINQSLATLRGWVAFGDPALPAERRQLWAEVIDPAFETLVALSPRWPDAGKREQLEVLERTLRELKYAQWAVEDVAGTPGNEPARARYAGEAESLRRNVFESLSDLLDTVEASARAGGRVPFRSVDIARFQADFAELDGALREALVDYSEQRADELRGLFQSGAETAQGLTTSLSGIASAEPRRLLAFALSEHRAYTRIGSDLLAVRASEEWNIARSLYQERAQPAARQAVSISGELAASETASVTITARRFATASYLAIALALVMGGASSLSLYSTLTLERTVGRLARTAKKLGQYNIERRIGRGGMGDVYLAHHAMMRRPTAVKVLRAELSQDISLRKRFQREVEFTSQLTHPNTIEIYDYGRTPDGIFYYAMEYLAGANLQDLVDRTGPTPPGRTIHIVRQLLGSLQEAHGRGYLHRDIKPANVMLCERGGVHDTVKVLDFGLVREVSARGETQLTQVGSIMGTPLYLAPEIITTQEYTPLSDLYAVGAVAYFLLTGKPPFDADDVVSICLMHVKDPPQPPSDCLGHALPGDLEALVLSCLAKDPSERPQTADRLGEMLEACEDADRWHAREARQWWVKHEASLKADRSDPAKPVTTTPSGLAIAINTQDRDE